MHLKLILNKIDLKNNTGLVMTRLLIISIITFFSASIVWSQSVNTSDQLKAAVDNLFEICKSENMDAAAKHIVYTGKDEKRHMTGLYNINDRKETSKVKRIMKKVTAFLKISDKHEFGKHNSTTENERAINSIEVLFISGNQELTTTFSFVEINGKLLLADIN